MVKNNCQIRFSYLCVFDFIILKIDYVNIEKRIFFFFQENTKSLIVVKTA